MSNHPIEGLMNESMEHIKQMVDVNTIVGSPVTTADGTTIIPISRVAFGFGAGGSEFNTKQTEKKDNNAMFGGGSGGGVSINPVAFLVVSGEQIKLLHVSNSLKTADKIIDLVPELISKFNKFTSEIIDKRNAKKQEKNDKTEENI